MSRIRFIALAIGLVLGISALLGACGPEETPLCRSDYECMEAQVCEPEGCRRACSEDSDCNVGQRCVLRRVEEGRVCGRVTP